MGNDKPEPPDPLSFLAEDAGPLSDRVVDGFLSAVSVGDPDRTQRIRGVFVRRLLETLHPTPVRTVEKMWSFGRWIEAIRKSVGLDRSDVAAAIGSDVDFIDRVERSDVLPWTLKETTIADLVCLFRLHITAVEQLFLTSQAIFPGQQSTNAVARSSALDPGARAESARRALDPDLAASSNRSRVAPLPVAAIENVRSELERRGARELLETPE
jgi:hypothetical protein